MTIDQQAPVAVHTADQLEVDDGEFSDFGSSIESDLTSLSSSIRTHVYENGRRYHSFNAGTYVLPNDESEQDSQHPTALVIGVDLSPIQPSWIPPNCSFEVDDVTKPWMWTEKFDFIHSANISQGIKDWPQYVKRIYDNLTPGGAVQLQEASLIFHTDDDSIPKGGSLDTYQHNFLKACKLAGIEGVTPLLESSLRGAGFVDVRVVIKKLPLGPWPKGPKKKALGRWGLSLAQTGLKAYGLALFTRVLGMSTEDATGLCDSAFKEICHRDTHTYAANYFVEGRKPKEEIPNKTNSSGRARR